MATTEPAAKPVVVTSLASRAVKRIVEVANAKNLTNESFHLQVLSLKEFDMTSSDAKKCVKLRFQLSDGESTVLAMMNKQVYDKMDDKIETYDVIEVFSFMKQTIKERTVLVLTKPPRLVYGKMKTKIGAPRDYAENIKDKVFDEDCHKDKCAIPKHVIQKQAMANGEDDQAIFDAVM